MKNQRYRWWHGVAFYAGVQLAQLAIRAAVRCARGGATAAISDGDRESYRSRRLPVYAPPAIAFPIAWSINCASLLAGGLHVLNLPEETEGRAEFLRLQASAWALFSLFNTAHFELRSPINAALLTFAYSAVTVASLAVALRRMEDRTAAFSVATTVAWLALANPLAVTQAAWNRDPFWNVGPLVMPPRGWEKSGK
ncbi:MAG: tryptophan-rich sensory protein [Acidobacteriaceae bacterium]